MKYSILIPTYNNCFGCVNAINSILNQRKIDDYEIIVLDDGSTDNTYVNLTKIFGDNQKVKIFNRCNKGVSQTRNELISKSSGKYILFLDSDDTFKQNLLEIIDRILKIDDFDYIRFNRVRQYFKKGTLVETFDESDSKNENFLCFNIDKSYSNYVNLYDKGFVKNVHCGVFKRSILMDEDVLFDNSLKYAEDTVFCINYLAHSKKVCKINQSLYLYNKVDDNNATAKFNHDLVKGVYAIDEAEVELLEKSTEQTKFKAKMRKLTRLINVYNHPRNQMSLDDKTKTIRKSSLYYDIKRFRFYEALGHLLNDKKMLVVYILIKMRMEKFVILISKLMFVRSIV